MAKSNIKNFKVLLKATLLEMIEENEALVKRIFEEAFEDAFMSNAIKQGKKTKKVSRHQIFQALSTTK